MIALRQAVERCIAEKIVDSLLSAGLSLSINNGGDDNEISPTIDKATVMGAMFATDEDTILIYDKDRVRFVKLVYGNNGWDVISDYNTSLEPLLIPITQAIDAIEAGRKQVTITF